MDNKLSRLQLDALKEVATIGAGHAATALSQMVGKKVDIAIPQTKLLPLAKAADIFGGPESLVLSVYFELLGDANGVILTAFHKQDAYRLIDILLSQPRNSTRVLNELGQSALEEISVILTGSYLSAISKFIKMRLLVTSPAFAEDMAGAIIDNVLIETAKESDYFFVIDTELNVVGKRIKAFFFFVPEANSLKKILYSLGLNLEE